MLKRIIWALVILVALLILYFMVSIPVGTQSHPI